ncbi:MarR family transcriptional regulator [Paenibacillus profundus]|uniref:MarR family transcriptional regulator n=1 Tax=Paenibacillus profundus TaxID=1173085 RepID=A0ABS8YCN4_9BACL|nr:MarR family transcriptional regulator [Paenibacillus profundus]MCE5169775.1 MarR family transcriptional regulator [Paenibacillus profundus]
MDAQSLFAIRQIIRKWHRYMNCKTFGTKYVLLELIEEQGTIFVADLANRLSLSQASVEEALHGLIISGLIQRVPDSEIAVKLTMTGTKLASSARDERQKWAQRYFTNESVQEFQLLYELLHHVICELDSDNAVQRRKHYPAARVDRA